MKVVAETDVTVEKIEEEMNGSSGLVGDVLLVGEAMAMLPPIFQTQP